MTARGSGPAIGDKVTLTHDASGSALHGRVRLCPTVGLVVDVDGRIFDMDRTGWHVSSKDFEPPEGSVVLDADNDAWQRRHDEWHCVIPGCLPRTWPELQQIFTPIEVVWEPTR